MNLQENIRRILREETNKILYSAVVLDNESRYKLLTKLEEFIPSDWRVIAHHMTIKFGEGVDKVGEEVDLIVTHIGISDMVVAVKVKGYPSSNKIPHVTLAVNPDGGKPVMSNNIQQWEEIKPFKISGQVKNIFK